MIMSYYDHFLDLYPMSVVIIISVHTNKQEKKFLLLNKGVKRKKCVTTFYAIPGFIAVLKIAAV